MPDQSSASTEHALMQEITAPLATLPDDPVPAVADVEFPTVAARIRPARRRRLRAEDEPARRRAAGDAFSRCGDPQGARAGGGGGVGDPAARARHGRARSPPSRAARPRIGSRQRAARRPDRQRRRRAGPRARCRDRPDLGRAPPDRRGHPRSGARAVDDHRFGGRPIPGRGRLPSASRCGPEPRRCRPVDDGRVDERRDAVLEEDDVESEDEASSPRTSSPMSRRTSSRPRAAGRRAGRGHGRARARDRAAR